MTRRHSQARILKDQAKIARIQRKEVERERDAELPWWRQRTLAAMIRKWRAQ